MVEPLKSLEEICQPDPRQLGSSIRTGRTGAARKRALADHYAAVVAFSLHEGVPEEVRSHWQTTRHLSIYAWYVYAFNVVAEMHTFATLELALRLRLPAGSFRPDKPPALGKLLRIAIEQNWLNDASLGDWNPHRRHHESRRMPSDDPHEYLRILVDAIPGIRNPIAHGAHMLWPTRYHSLGLVAAAINALYANRITTA